jgi:hypothetical protein
MLQAGSSWLVSVAAMGLSYPGGIVYHHDPDDIAVLGWEEFSELLLMLGGDVGGRSRRSWGDQDQPGPPCGSVTCGLR